MSNGTSRFGMASPLLLIMRVAIVILAGWPGWLFISRSITAEFGGNLAPADLETLDIITLGRATAEGAKALPGVAAASLGAALLLDQMLAVAAVRTSSSQAERGVWSTFWREGPAWLVPLLKLAVLGLAAGGAAAALANLGADQATDYGTRQGWTNLASVVGVRVAQVALTLLLVAIVSAKVFWLRTAMLISGRRALWRNLWHAPKWLWRSKGAVLVLGIVIWLLELAGLALHAMMRPGHATVSYWALWGVWILLGAIVWLAAIRSSTRRYLVYTQPYGAVRASTPERAVEPPPPNVPPTDPVQVALPPEPEA